jgi:hypothetical protein
MGVDGNSLVEQVSDPLSSLLFICFVGVVSFSRSQDFGLLKWYCYYSGIWDVASRIMGERTSYVCDFVKGYLSLYYNPGMEERPAQEGESVVQ